MTWSSVWPIGGISVKANRTAGDNNMVYIKETMGKDIVGTNTVTMRDHFWAVGPVEDGRHRMIQSPAFTVGLNPEDPLLGTGMGAVLYAKTVLDTVQWFTRNASTIYQATPGYYSGVINNLTSSYVNLFPVPANSYGEIFMYRTTQGEHTAQTGFFRSDAGTVEAWSLYLGPKGESSEINLKFGNGSDATDLNIRVKTATASSGNNWNYKIFYRAL